jgi:adenylate cyclase
VASSISDVRPDEEGPLAALKAIRRDLIDHKIAEHCGRIVKTTGGGLLVELMSPFIHGRGI